MPARDAAVSPRLALTADRSTEAALAQMAEAGLPGAPVIGAHGTLLGSLDVAGADVGAGATVGQQQLSRLAIAADDPLDAALGALVDNEREWAPVEEHGRLIGVLSMRDIMDAYRRALAGNVRRVRSAGTGGEQFIEADVAPHSVLVGMTLAQAPLPRDVVVWVERGDHIIGPRGDSVLEAGDRLSVFTTPAGKQPLLDLLAERTR